jgi:hypothetical protein
MVQKLEYDKATQHIGIQATSARQHNPDGPKTTHALTFKVDHFMRVINI